MRKLLKTGKMTLEKLAIMTANGFDNLKNELMGEIGGLKGEIKEFKLEVNERFNHVDDRLERIENNNYELVNSDAKTEREIIRLKKRRKTRRGQGEDPNRQSVG